MASSETSGDLIERFAEATVLCLGDVMLDSFIYGEVARISPEAPIPVLRIRHREDMLGGAGNVAANVAALGARAILVGLVGEDAAGSAVAALAEFKAKVAARLVETPDRPTSHKTRYLAEGQQLLRADEEATGAVTDKAATQLLAAFEAALPDADVVVLSDYAKGTLGDAVLAGAIKAAREAGKPVLVDPKRTDFSAYAGVDLIKPNLRELAEATGMAPGDDASVAAAGRAALEAADAKALLVTRSGAGMSLFGRAGVAWHIAAEAREVFDVSGAGDSVMATLAVALAAGVELHEAAVLANLAGGVVVGKVGTAVVRPEDLREAQRARRVNRSEAKLVGAEAALEAVRQWRAQGLRVGFTNGCFDLLHPGHISLMRQARQACDRLIVGLNDDASVARLKGPGRPIQDEVARAIVLASLEDVDLVVLFAEDTPLELIAALRPEVLVKGADYREDEVVGGAEVKSWDGEVVLARLEEGHSTTRTLARLAAGRSGGGA